MATAVNNYKEIVSDMAETTKRTITESKLLFAVFLDFGVKAKIPKDPICGPEFTDEIPCHTGAPRAAL